MRNFCSCLILITICAALKAQLPPYVPTNGLQGFWPFTGNANDISGNGRNGTVYSASSTTDRFSNSGCAYNFAGGADIKTQYAGILGTNPRAVSFWARTSHSVTIMCGVAWGAIATAARYECGFNYGAPGPMLDGGNGVITYSPTVPAYDNAWHHYVMQFGSSSALNKVEIDQDAVLLTNTSNVYSGSNILSTFNNFAVRFGSIPGSPDHYFRGDLDDIGIWDRPLSELEIRALFNGSNCPNTPGERSVPCVSIQEEDQFPANVFPNPVSDILKVSGIGATSTISVINISGQVLSTSTFIEDGEIDFSSFPAGIYLLEIVDRSGAHHLKVVKD